MALHTAESRIPPTATVPPVSYVPPAPRWAVVAAHLTVLSVLPSSLWRFAMAIGIPVGFSEEVMRTVYHSPGWGTVYMLGLCVVGELAAFMTIGLVRNWGLVTPRWIPFIGRKRVRPLAAIIPAACASVVMTLLWWSQAFLAFLGPPAGLLSPTADVVMRVFYAPLVLWGPLLGAVTWSYWRRTRPARATRTARPDGAAA